MPALPQTSVPPQLSEIKPQLLPCAAQVVFVQQVCIELQTCVVPSQAPQLSDGPPQPSGDVPHVQPAGHDVFGVHTPQMLAVPEPPHVSPSPVHAPQSSMPPQPSLTGPQLFPSSAQVCGAQHLLW